MNRNILFLILTMIISTYGYGQDLFTVIDDTVSYNPNIFTVVEVMPQFPGGDSARIMYLSQNIRYPIEAREKGIQGRVFITFVVEGDGRISNVKLLRGIGGSCDEVALNLVKNMPNWIPGQQRGKNVRVQFNMPIAFRIDGVSSIPKWDNFYEKGNVFFDQQKYEKAIARYSKSIDKKGSFYKEAYLNRGISKYHMRNFDGAIEDMKKAIELGARFNSEKQALVYFEIGNEYFDKKEYDKALESYNESANLTPEDGNIYFNIGIVNFYLGNKEQACKDMHKAKELGKEDAEQIIGERCK
ncbi:MAG: TonB family protein [Chlorobi bacterium]|nr:TonB family protein [Chlorobiota bacterium]